ncbi:hypothetical protein BDV97DRAFT_17899 [Delphinella strobiligena]|nr:hypothetical protein BDV97DRAFT_17899 [Delphinella strobiligena]
MALQGPHVTHPQAPLAYTTPLSSALSSHSDAEVQKSSHTTFATSTIPLTVASTLSATKQSLVDLNGLSYPNPSSSTGGAESPYHTPMVGRRSRKCSAGFLTILLTYLTLSLLQRHYDHGGSPSELAEESQWIASSPSWLDRQSCRWFGLCGAFHLNRAGWIAKGPSARNEQERLQELEALSTPPNLNSDSSSYWLSGQEDPNTWSANERIIRRVPSYVYDYTPYVHLFSGEEFWPGDIADHLIHTTPYLNYTRIRDLEHDITVDNLDELNEYGRSTYLQSNDNVEERPTWLGGSKNIPSSNFDDNIKYTPPLLGPSTGYVAPDVYDEGWWEVGTGDVKDQGGIRPNPGRPNAAVPVDTVHGEEKVHADTAQREGIMDSLRKRNVTHSGGRSSAPAVLVVVPKSHGVVDAFWFYFYSYNLGNKVFNIRFGNHVGDWEHSVVRFHHGVPKAVFLSEHNFGEAYSYKAVEKIGSRPVIYSAVGSHAMYATSGIHPYVLPWGLLHDETDKGPLWDPLLNHHAFVYNYTTGTLQSSTQTPRAPVSWFNFGGHWGDKFYPLSDPRQYRFAGQYHYVNGPYGPKFKNLGRKKICQGNGKCVLKDWLGDPTLKRSADSGDEKQGREGQVPYTM